ncbi:MAG: two-component system response regulator [Polynucleobacter sp. 24-46-87]|jgi:DNA-binding NtrC family response regulator|uniref:response regulator n=1 Tax=unclassified Polynucleobacter TaxID=2640945 RepID=UPI000BC67F7A|nr:MULTISPECIES: response regulator [unclassified Polynucleobacter]OYY14191.1 MAG: two-component system response regulator [Polynucleobacter sp. 35-46-11]OZA14361.1 MAG: two-component system response regulator [Polynucleobacter sp. 24-46-87]OZA75570.1 MAG: two-component system response regulator [Polynucleobacter sp. 39-46-10]
MASILVVDDEMGIRELLNEILTDEGHTVYAAESAMQARTIREQMRPDLVLLDIWMPEVDGITLLKEWSKTGQLTMPVVMMSGHATIDTAVEATRIGALNFLEKPIALQKLLKTVNKALESAPKFIEPVEERVPSASSSSPTPRVAASEKVTQVQEGEYISGIAKTYFDLPLREARDLFEKAYFEHQMIIMGGSMTKISEYTGLERTHLYRKLKALGIDTSRNKAEQ